MDELQLVKAAQAGNAAAFGELAGQYQRALVGSAVHITRQTEEAEDLAQESLVAAYRGLSTLRDPRRFRGWLFAILRHTCLHWLKSHPPVTVPLDAVAETLAAETLAAAMPESSRLLPLLAQLSQDDREIIAARYLADLNYAEIGQAFGISAVAARVRCARARTRLRATVEQAEEQETRQWLGGAMAGVLVLSPTEVFTQGVQQEVETMTSMQNAVGTLTATSVITAGAKTALAVGTGWKMAMATAGVIALLAAGVETAKFLRPAPQADAATAAVQEVEATPAAGAMVEAVHLTYTMTVDRPALPQQAIDEKINRYERMMQESIARNPDKAETIRSKYQQDQHDVRARAVEKNATEQHTVEYWGTRENSLIIGGGKAHVYNGRYFIWGPTEVFGLPGTANDGEKSIPPATLQVSAEPYTSMPQLGFVIPGQSLSNSARMRVVARKDTENGYEEISEYIPPKERAQSDNETLKFRMQYNSQGRLTFIGLADLPRVTGETVAEYHFRDFTEVDGFAFPRTAETRFPTGYYARADGTIVWCNDLSLTYRVTKAEVKRVPASMFTCEYPPVGYMISDMRYATKKASGEYSLDSNDQGKPLEYHYTDPTKTLDEASAEAAKAQ